MGAASWCSPVLLLIVLGLASSEALFEGHAVLSCEINTGEQARELVAQIRRFDGDMWTHHISPGSNVHVQLAGEHLAGFRDQFNCDTLIDNLQETVDRHLQDLGESAAPPESAALPVNGADHSWFKKYHRFDDQVKKLQQISEKHPDIAHFVPSIGEKTHEGREIPAVHITKQSGSDSRKSQIVLLGGQHAREWDASASVIFFADALTGSHKSDAVVSQLLDKFEFVVIPNLNPDGYEFSHTSNRLWRKNRRNNGDGTFGVDLNRNWPNHWGEGEASTKTSATDYQGPSVASEPEIKAASAYVKKLSHPIAGIDFHTYGELVLRSKGWTQDKSQDENLLKSLGATIQKAAAKHNGGHYKSETAAGLYPTTGSADDFMSENVGKGKMWAHGWTIELPPSQSNGAGFLLPAKRILPTATGMFESIKQFSKALVKQGELREKMGPKEFAEQWEAGRLELGDDGHHHSDNVKANDNDKTNPSDAVVSLDSVGSEPSL